MDSSTEINHIELCAGGGMLGEAIRLCLPSLRTVCYVEREAYAAALLATRMEEGALDACPIWTDLTTFDARRWRGCVDNISAGFPCQPWSTAGRRKGTEDERWIWPSIVGIIRDARPSFVFLENVAGFVRGGIEHCLGDLADMGFDAEWGVFRASEVGAPHGRARWYCFAHANSAGLQGRFWVPSGEREKFAVSVERDVSLLPDIQSIRHSVEAGLPTQPCVHGMDDGMADVLEHRVSAIRLGGNGVVPVQGAAAFVELYRRAFLAGRE